MRDWIERNVISARDIRAIGFALAGIGLVLLLAGVADGLWQAGAPGFALLLVAGYVLAVRRY